MPRPERRSGSPRRRAAAPLAAFALIVATLGAPGLAWAWGRNAHRAAAKLAESRLTPAARAAVRDLLEPGETLADASTWADEHSRDVPGSASWHFVNVPIRAEHYSPDDCRDSCVVHRLREFRRILADRSAPRERRRMALRYVVHLVEDVHQPMHVGDDRDRGGNTLQLQFFHDDPSNLHQVWDSRLFYYGLRNERGVTDAVFDLAKKRESQEWLKGDVEDWADESLQAAKTAYLVPGREERIRPGARLGQEYLDANLPTAVKRVAQAGMRLSEVLNTDLDPSWKSAIPAPHFNRSRVGKSAPAPSRP